jgi:YgiT-type zinc finger domain-containing protein
MPVPYCPTCGSPNIRRRRTAVTFPLPKGNKVVRGLMLEVCDDCGEKLFDLKASRKVDEALGIRYPSKKKKVA